MDNFLSKTDTDCKDEKQMSAPEEATQQNNSGKKAPPYWTMALIAVFGICAAVLLAQVLIPPQAGKSPEAVEAENQEEQVSTSELEIKALTRRVTTLEENIKKIYSNQVELNKTISELLKNEEATKKANKENRAYIAMMYQKVLDIELRVENGLGGGFNVRQKAPEEAINPLMGTEDSLPPPLPQP